jgi:serine/threonine-protein kinase RsbW
LWLVDVNWTLLLPREAESVGKARRMLRDTATLAGVDPEVSFDLGVALTEACANVIEHAGQAEGYWVAAGISSDRCWIDVIDNGVGFAPRRLTEHAAGTSRWQRARITSVPAQDAPAPQPVGSQPAVSQAAVSQALVSQMSESGRGLMLIEALCDRVDIRNHPARGAMIHFERDLKPQTQLAA